MRKAYKYRNTIGDFFYSDKKHEEEMAKLDALNAIANKSSQTSTLLYVIPIIGIVFAGVLIAVALKKKKA